MSSERPARTTEELPTQLQRLAQDLNGFLDCLNGLPEGKQHWISSTITVLEMNLKYWASCLKQYTGS